MDFLKKIIEEKRKEAAALSVSKRLDDLEANILKAAAPLDFRGALNKGMSIIAEVKRKSPSKGHLSDVGDPSELAHLYQKHGARAVSVLTDSKHFGGSLEDLALVRKRVCIPVLRKDFIINPAQVLESRSVGADAFLLIASILEEEELASLISLGEDLGMTALVEVHSAPELDKALGCGARTIGINNRNLRTFDVDIRTCLEMIGKIPSGTTAVAESGILNCSDIARIASAGFQAFLIGEALVTSRDPGETIKTFLKAAETASKGGSCAG